MPRKLTRQQLVKKLDKVFSEYIRRKDADVNGNVKCVTCSKISHYKTMHCGHFQPRQYKTTRWEEDNVAVQCPGCNTFRGGEQYLFARYLDRKRSGLSKSLYEKSRENKKILTVEIEEMIEIYKEKIKGLNNE